MGIACFAISMRGTSVSELATNRLTPMGGVTKPIARFTTIITPKWIGSMPMDSTIGSRIGVRIRIAGVVSMTIPTISRNALITRRRTIGFVKCDRIHELIACGTCISVSTLENAIAAALARGEGLELAADPGLRNMWGPLLDAMWNDMYHSQGVLGGAIWVGIDDTFFLPGDKAIGYGTWGVIDGWRREKPEYWGMKKAYSPVKLKLAGNVGADGTVRIEAENRHLFTNLSECRIEWRAGGGSGTVQTDIEPRGEGVIEIRLPDSLKRCKTLDLRVVGVRGFEVDRYSFHIAPEVELCTAEKPKRMPKIQCNEQPDAFEVETGGRRFTVDKRNGLLTVERDGQPLLTGDPSLMVLPLNAEGEGIQMTGKDQKFAPYNPVCRNWTAERVVCTPGNDRVEIAVSGRYAEAEGTLTYGIAADGSLTVGYDFTMEQAVSPRQVGLVFDLPARYDQLDWTRRGYWSVYPEDHIGALSGHARAFDKRLPISGLAGPSRQPDVAWGLDQPEIAVMKKNNIVFEKDADPYVSPLYYTDSPRLSGFLSAKNGELLRGTPAVFAKKRGSGSVIVFADDMNFRSYYFGTSKIFMNAVFFGKCM